MLKIKELRTEYRIRPIDVDTRVPAFSWKLESDRQETMQTKYHILVATDNGNVWDSGIVKSDQSIHILYDGAKIHPRKHYDVTVEIWDNHGERATYSDWFETSLLSPEHIKANWITHAFEDELEPCAVFKKTFEVRDDIKRARIYASALGTYEFTLNGKKVGDILLAPGWTSYDKRIQYQTYDVTELLSSDNTIEMTVSDGWYKGIIGFVKKGCHYGNRTAALMQIEIEYADKSMDRIITDESWMCTTGVNRYASWYNGQVIDYTFKAPQAVPVKLYDYAKENLIAQQCEPVRIVERIPAKELIITPKGETVINFGQNIAGIVEARLNCPKGTKVTLYHGERLDGEGNFFNENLRSAQAKDIFICSGNEDVFLPSFTGHGFQYVKVEGLGEDIDISCFTACVTHTDYEQAGYFESGNADVNQLWRNIDWTMRGNSVDIPTDCPQRDERMGYTGDAEMFLSTALHLKNAALFYRKWMKDMYADQGDNGAIPMLSPNFEQLVGGGPAVWHDAGTIVPWTLWNVYGDKRFLSESYEGMKACVEFSRNVAGEAGLRLTTHELGDWVSLDAPKGPFRKAPEGIMVPTGEDRAGGTDQWFVANTYYAYSTWILCETAKILGYEEDVKIYEALYKEIVENFREQYVTAKGRLVSETQTSCALALQFNMVEEKHREKILNKLIDRLRRHENHLVSGFVGTQFICRVLSDNGQHKLAGKVFLQEDCPSWLYEVKLGATTVWELWDGVNEDGSINRFEMNSFNQYSYASIGDWMHTRLGGITHLEPGYKKSRIAPRLIRRVPSVNTSIETVYGKLSCALTCKDGKYAADICVPANTTAVISLPEKEEFEVGSGCYHYEYATDAVFESLKYSKESTVGEIVKTAMAKEILAKEAPQVLVDYMFLSHCRDYELHQIHTYVPQEIEDLFLKIADALNAAEK